MKNSSILPLEVPAVPADSGREAVEAFDGLLNSLSKYAVSRPDSEDMTDLATTILHHLQTSSVFAEEAINRYLALTDGLEKQLLGTILYDAGSSVVGTELEKIVAHLLQLDVNENNVALFELVEHIGVHSIDSRDQLLSALPSLSSADNIS